ncbi:MAG: hypothetical protein LBU32_27755 [Clostridiales bacterium]|jgi:hypothetical protein|nr:hypothetical protein [Clostridiales bacterium]
MQSEKKQTLAYHPPVLMRLLFLNNGGLLKNAALSERPQIRTNYFAPSKLKAISHSTAKYSEAAEGLAPLFWRLQEGAETASGIFILYYYYLTVLSNENVIRIKIALIYPSFKAMIQAGFIRAPMGLNSF